MKTYGEYEELLVERLKNKEWDVSPLPLTASLNAPLSRPRIFILFAGSTFEDTTRLGDFGQWEILSFEVYIVARTREGVSSVFEVGEEVIQRLLKWQIADATEKITLTSFGFADGGQNNWQYNLKFTFPRARVMREEKTEPIIIEKITHEINMI